MPSSGGVFEVIYNGALIYSKKREGRFPEKEEIDRLIESQTAKGDD